MSKHTPGPWHVGTQNDLLYVIDNRPATSNDYPQHNAEVAAIAKVYCGNSSAANARLISAAPELLEALIKCRDEMGQLPHSLGYEFTHLRALNALIAKATGESP